jgi:hypothetical protein
MATTGSSLQQIHCWCCNNHLSVIYDYTLDAITTCFVWSMPEEGEGENVLFISKKKVISLQQERNLNFSQKKKRKKPE